MAAGHCTQAELGQFIIDLPDGKSMSNTSFWSARVVLPDKSVGSNTTAVDLRHSAAGTPPSERTSSWRRDLSSTPDRTLSRRQSLNTSPQSPYHYTESIHYIVEKTGYYCVGMWISMFINTTIFTILDQLLFPSPCNPLLYGETLFTRPIKAPSCFATPLMEN